jgi:branched-chain amino acid transport system ATP-binding protein
MPAKVPTSSLVAPLRPALELDHVSASYARFRALFDVSFSVADGSVAVMLGPNGAGKSTIARVVTGLVPTTSGRIFIQGSDVTRLSPARIVRRGVTLAPEGRPVFATLDVEDNLRLTFCRQLPRGEVAGAMERAYGRFPFLKSRRRQLGGTLSGGEQRILALARVLAVPPKLLVVDELSLGLAPRIVDEVFGALREINQAGTTLLVVEQQAKRALELADQVIILRKGRVTHSGMASDLSDDLAAELLPVPPDVA